MPKTDTPKRKPTDATMRNVEASPHRDEALEARIEKLEAQMREIAKLFGVERIP